MILFLQILVALLAVVLVILVLLQQGKGSDLGSAFGGGSSNSCLLYTSDAADDS